MTIVVNSHLRGRNVVFSDHDHGAHSAWSDVLFRSTPMSTVLTAGVALVGQLKLQQHS